MLKSYEETIDEVVKSDVVQPFPDANRRATQAIVRGRKNFSAISVNCSSEPFPNDRASLSKALLVDYKQIKNTLSKCSKRPNLSSRSFFNLFRYFDRKSNKEKRIFTSLKQAVLTFWAQPNRRV